MTFNPSSTIYLCNVPIDNTYKHQIYFSTMAKQKEYFSKRVVKTFSEYLTVRKTLADGALQSSIKVNANIDELYNCNYMYYQNANHGVRYFYAFITKLIYVNEGTTEIVFETDVYQTWHFYTELKESYVVREHSETDVRGANLVPESFVVSDFKYTKVDDSVTDFGQWGYLIACTECLLYDEANKPAVGKHSGIYQGIYFYYFTSFIHINDLIEKLDDHGKDSILSITAIPEISVKHAKMDWRTIDSGGNVVDHTNIGLISTTDYPNEKDISVSADIVKNMDGHDVKNNKLWTFPFFSLIVSNNSGSVREYNVDDFVNRNAITFRLYGDISTTPSLYLTPQHYKGVVEGSNKDDVYGECVDFGISIDGFPQCAFINDFYKLWSAKNAGSQAIGYTTGAISTAVGTVVALTGNPIVGGGMALGGVTTIANTINKSYAASVEADNATIGSPKNNLLTAMKRNKFDMRFKTLKKDQAESIDNFFTMYGYQTNKLKVPNCSSRPYFNYVQTVDVNIVGTIPDDDMTMLKNMYNNGVTFWKPDATVGDYSVDNSP